jgi:hypothetical protein
MSASLLDWKLSEPWTRRRLDGRATPQERAAFWRINGHRARLLIWTPDEWARMETPPADAQFHPTGVWCALRLE